MKTTTLFQLGGIALVLSAVLFGIGNLMYFLSGEQPLTTLGLWIAIIGDALQVLGVFALFARQAQRSGVLGLIGFVLVVCSNMAETGSLAVQLGVAAGVISNEQVTQVASYTLVGSILTWISVAGFIALGISIYRAQAFPKYAGALLVLVGLIQPLTGPLAFTRPIFALVSFVAWAWLGWVLMTGTRESATDNRVVSQERAPAT